MSTFTVTTWNLLAQAYIKPERYPHSPPEALRPEPRRRLLLDHIRSSNSDIYCFQEVEADTYAAISEVLPHHLGRYAPKSSRPDGSAMFIAEHLGLLDHEILHFQAQATGHEQLALLVKLTIDERPLVVVSTHLQWQPVQTERSNHLGRAQLLEILARQSVLRVDWPSWIIAGDFNALSESVVVQAALEQGFRLSCRSQRPWDTVNIHGRRRKLDYLLYTPETLIPTPGHLPKLEPTTPMPSSRFPSDHLPVHVRYAWRE